MGIKNKMVLHGTGLKETKRVFDYLKTLDKDGTYRLFFCDMKKIRSSSQNRYYWGVVLDTLSQLTGIETGDLHDLMKAKFNMKIITVGDENVEVGGDTKNLNTKEFSQFIDKIRRWAATELDCHIPEANEIPDDTIIELMNMSV